MIILKIVKNFILTLLEANIQIKINYDNLFLTLLGIKKKMEIKKEIDEECAKGYYRKEERKNMEILKYKKDKEVEGLRKEGENKAGYILYSRENKIIKEFSKELFKTGIYIELPIEIHMDM